MQERMVLTMRVFPLRIQNPLFGNLVGRWVCGDQFCAIGHRSWLIAAWHGVLAWLETEPPSRPGACA